MTVGFVVFGAGVIAFGAALRVVCAGRTWMAAVATGACTVGVAATPLGGWSGDAVHATFAGAGYVTLVALPILAAGPLARSGHRGRRPVLGSRGPRVGRVPRGQHARPGPRALAAARVDGG